MTAIAATGDRPNAPADNLRKHVTGAIAVLLPKLATPVAAHDPCFAEVFGRTRTDGLMVPDGMSLAGGPLVHGATS